MIRRPQVLLMDEPLTNLDAQLRSEMRAELKHLQREQNVTTVYVTHDQVEAMALGDRITVMSKGGIQQVGAPMEVYRHPATLFVAGFLGTPPMSLIPCELKRNNGIVQASSGAFAVALPPALAALVEARPGLSRVVVGLRPEAVGLTLNAPTSQGASRAFAATVYAVEPLGDENIVDVRLVVPGGGSVPLLARTVPALRPRARARVWITPISAEVHIFDPNSGEAIRI